MKYLIVLEESEGNFGAFVPDVPGCVAAGESKKEVMALIQEAISFHIEGLSEENIPVPVCTGEVVEVNVMRGHC